jgi:hypothetical protein
MVEHRVHRLDVPLMPRGRIVVPVSFFYYY